MAPSQLTIATSAVERLVKEERSYHTELAQQNERVAKIEAEALKPGADEELSYQLKQEKRARDETMAVLEPMKKNIRVAIEKLEDQLEAEKGAGPVAPVEEIIKANEVLAEAKKAYGELA